MVCGCSERNTPDVTPVVKECAVMPSPRAGASACAIGDKGYVFGGRDQNGRYLKDLWQYDSQSDTWSRINSFPGRARFKPLMAVYEDALYIGLGFAGGQAYDDSCYLRDLWKYTPENGQWTELAPALNHNVIGGVPYLTGQRLYMLYATGWSYTNEVVYYDLTADEWTIVPSTGERAESCLGGAGAQCAGRCFFGAGVRKENLCQWYEVDLEADRWSQRASFPGKGREACACCATNDCVYLFGGRYFGGEHTGGEVYNDYLRYSVAEDRWERCGAMPAGRKENMIAFTINGTAYFGLGEDENGQLTDRLYRIEQ